eukprot:838512-Amorphochlora_amoeboformis.AAC.1
MAPKGENWEKAKYIKHTMHIVTHSHIRQVEYWKTLPSDPGATYDSEVKLDASQVAPMVTWGTSPEDVVAVTGIVPDPEKEG